MKKNLIKIFAATLLAAASVGCSSDRDDVDTEKPVIVLDYANNFPQNCSVLKRGSTIEFRAKFTDNEELGSYNVDIHNNFDHHNHTTEEQSGCTLGEKKTAVNPLIFNQTYSLPAGRNSVEVTQSIAIPAGVDTGDYHFMIKVTDKAGYTSIRGLSVKITD